MLKGADAGPEFLQHAPTIQKPVDIVVDTGSSPNFQFFEGSEACTPEERQRAMRQVLAQGIPRYTLTE